MSECRRLVDEGVVAFPCSLGLPEGHAGPCAAKEKPGSMRRRALWVEENFPPDSGYVEPRRSVEFMVEEGSISDPPRPRTQRTPDRPYVPEPEPTPEPEPAPEPVPTFTPEPVNGHEQMVADFRASDAEELAEEVRVLIASRAAERDAVLRSLVLFVPSAMLPSARAHLDAAYRLIDLCTNIADVCALSRWGSPVTQEVSGDASR